MKINIAFVVGFLMIFFGCSNNNNEPKDFYNSCAQYNNTSLVVFTTIRQLGLAYKDNPSIATIHSSLQTLEFAEKTFTKEFAKFADVNKNDADEKELHGLFLEIGNAIDATIKNNLYPLKNMALATPTEKVSKEMKVLETKYGKLMDLMDVINPKLDAFAKKHDINTSEVIN